MIADVGCCLRDNLRPLSRDHKGAVRLMKPLPYGHGSVRFVGVLELRFTHDRRFGQCPTISNSDSRAQDLAAAAGRHGLTLRATTPAGGSGHTPAAVRIS